MPTLNESSIEQFAIEILQSLGWDYVFGPDIAPDSENPPLQIANRQSFEDVLLFDVLKRSLQRINPNIPDHVLNDAIKRIVQINAPDLIANNETFHRMLTDGVNVVYRKDGEERGDIVRLIDFNNLGNNEFLVVNQFTVVENGVNRRPDIVLFVNGIPLVVFELKNPADENATIKSAFNQIQTYKQDIPSLFTYNEIIVISDGLEAKAGSLSAGFDRFMAWKSVDGRIEASRFSSSLETLIKGMLNKKVFLDLIENFIVFSEEKKEDLQTGQVFVKKNKILAAYHQYFAVNKAVESALRASGFVDKGFDMVAEPSIGYAAKQSVNSGEVGDRKAGVIWHTQGSGKSLSMVFFTGKIVRLMDNPTVVVITDRNDLDNQLFSTFSSSKGLLRQSPVQAESREHLKELLKVASGGVVFTTIHKFWPEEGNTYETLSLRSNIIVIADEAHRTQYGFKGKVNKKSGEISFGFAKYLRDALPNATFIGFTGTPIEEDDRNTPMVFGNYIDIYDISRAVKDGVTVPIYYESRLVKVEVSEKGKNLIEEFEEEFFEENSRKFRLMEALIGSRERVKTVAKDIVEHFEKRIEAFDGKGMIVAVSRPVAVRLYNEIVKLRPEWHSDEISKGFIKIVFTSSASDGPEIAKHHTTKEQRQYLANRMKDPDDELKLVIVVDMWLTGFDVPCLHTMYIDKPMKGHTLMQAIARVNRVYKDKPGGLIVDYIGIASDLKKAISFYTRSGGKGNPAELQEKAVKVMLEKYEIVKDMFFGFDYLAYFKADTREKLEIILKAEDYILGLENGKKRYVDAVTALSRAFALATPHKKALEIKHEVAFFQAVKSRIVKFVRGEGKTKEEIETAVKQIVDSAVVTKEVIDVLDSAGIEKPDISVLSDEFLMEVRDYKHKNIAIEVLKKIIRGELKTRGKINIVKTKTLLESLEETINSYNNRVLTAVQVIEELIRIAKEIKNMDKEPEEMGLSKYEYAFYSAVAQNESAQELMGKEMLRELAVVLFEKVRQNTSIDWTIRESARAKLKVIVKRTLRQYGYPPDMQALATETVLKQAELIADELIAAG